MTPCSGSVGGWVGEPVQTKDSANRVERREGHRATLRLGGVVCGAVGGEGQLTVATAEPATVPAAPAAAMRQACWQRPCPHPAHPTPSLSPPRDPPKKQTQLCQQLAQQRRSLSKLFGVSYVVGNLAQRSRHLVGLASMLTRGGSGRRWRWRRRGNILFSGRGAPLLLLVLKLLLLELLLCVILCRPLPFIVI